MDEALAAQEATLRVREAQLSARLPDGLKSLSYAGTMVHERGCMADALEVKLQSCGCARAQRRCP